MATILVYPKEQAEGAGNDTDTLQAAIDAASPGDVLLLKATNVGGASKRWLLHKIAGATFPQVYVMGTAYSQYGIQDNTWAGVSGGNSVHGPLVLDNMQNIIIDKSITLRGEVDGNGKPLTKISSYITKSACLDNSITWQTDPSWWQAERGGTLITSGSASDHRPRVALENLCFEYGSTHAVKVQTLTDIENCKFSFSGGVIFRLDNRITYPLYNPSASAPDFSNPNKISIKNSVFEYVLGFGAVQNHGGVSELEFSNNRLGFDADDADMTTLLQNWGSWGGMYTSSDSFFLDCHTDDSFFVTPGVRGQVSGKYYRNIVVKDNEFKYPANSTNPVVTFPCWIRICEGARGENIVVDSNEFTNAPSIDSNGMDQTYLGLSGIMIFANTHYNLLRGPYFMNPAQLKEDNGIKGVEVTNNIMTGMPGICYVSGKFTSGVGLNYDLYKCEDVVVAGNKSIDDWKRPSGSADVYSIFIRCAERATITNNDFKDSGRLTRLQSSLDTCVFFGGVRNSQVFESGSFPPGQGGVENHYNQANPLMGQNYPVGTGSVRVPATNNRIIGLSVAAYSDSTSNDNGNEAADDKVKFSKQERESLKAAIP